MKNQYTEGYKIIFLTTFQNEKYIIELLKSIYLSNENIKCLVIIIAQNGKTINVDKYNSSYVHCVLIENEILLPLSIARNIGLKYIYDNKIESEYIMFPDDDSTFDNTFFHNIEYIDFDNALINVRNSDSDGYFLEIPKSLKKLEKKHYHFACSVNIVTRLYLAEKVGFFDENLGLGAEYGSGEDNDYYLRLLKISTFINYPLLYTKHPAAKSKIDKINIKGLIKRYKNYGRGVVYMLCKNKLYLSALYLCFKALIAALLYLIKFDFKRSIAYFFSFFSRISVFFNFIFR